MNKINFTNLPSTTTPVNATNLNAMQTNAENAINAVDTKVGNWGNADAISDYTGDMNDLKVSGWYATGTINANLPTNEPYYVIVMTKNPDYYIKQIAFKRNNYMIYERHKDNGVWSNWTKMDNSVSSYDGDLNNLTTTGFYYVSGSSTNIPTTGFSHYVTVYKLSDNFICQVAYRVTNTDNAQYMFIRQRYSGTWTGWLSMLRDYIGPLQNDVDFNTITSKGTYFEAGTPTGSNKPPVAEAGCLEVIAYGSFIIQRYTSYTGSTICVRGKFSTNAWGGWKKVTLS